MQAAQSTLFDELLDAVATVCKFGSGLHASKIVEWYDDNRPNVEGQQCISIRFTEWLPDEYPGAGRAGSLCYLGIRVTIWTRMMLDKASTDKWRFRNAAVGHLPRLMGCLDRLDGEVLFNAYNPTTKLSTGTPLSWEPLQHMPGIFCERVDNNDETWIKSALNFRTTVATPLTVADE